MLPSDCSEVPCRCRSIDKKRIHPCTHTVDPAMARKKPVYALIHRQSCDVCALKCDEGDELIEEESMAIIEEEELAAIKTELLLASATTTHLRRKVHCFENEDRAQEIILSSRRKVAGSVALDKVTTLEDEVRENKAKSDKKFQNVQSQLDQKVSKGELTSTLQMD